MNKFHIWPDGTSCQADELGEMSHMPGDYTTYEWEPAHRWIHEVSGTEAAQIVECLQEHDPDQLGFPPLPHTYSTIIKNGGWALWDECGQFSSLYETLEQAVVAHVLYCQKL